MIAPNVHNFPERFKCLPGFLSIRTTPFWLGPWSPALPSEPARRGCLDLLSIPPCTVVWFHKSPSQSKLFAGVIISNTKFQNFMLIISNARKILHLFEKYAGANCKKKNHHTKCLVFDEFMYVQHVMNKNCI